MRSVSSLGGSGSHFFHSIGAHSQVLLVLLPDVDDSASSIQLASHVLVSLAELVQLPRDVVVLLLKDLSVLLKGIFLVKQVNVVVSHLGVLELATIQLFPHSVHLVVLVLHSELQVSYLNCQVVVPC